MSIACTLGLTACLTFQGVQIPAKAAIEVMDDCGLIAQMEPNNFLDRSRVAAMPARVALKATSGTAVGEAIQDRGVALDWEGEGHVRQLKWQRTCMAFSQAFRDRSRGWKHLDKWPGG